MTLDAGIFTVTQPTRALDVLDFIADVEAVLQQPDVFVTDCGEVISHVHAETDDCREHGCVIHNPWRHVMSKFPTHWRSDRFLMERICPHGIGHPDPNDLAWKCRTYGEEYAQTESVHGCDGCCAGAYEGVFK